MTGAARVACASLQAALSINRVAQPAHHFASVIALRDQGVGGGGAGVIRTQQTHMRCHLQIQMI